MSLAVGNIEGLVQTLDGVLDPETQKQAEEVLKLYLKDPRCLSDLYTVLTIPGCTDRVKSQAAVQMVQHVKHIKAYPDADRVQFQSLILQLIVSEPSMLVGRKLCEVVAGLFKIGMDKGEAGAEVFALITQLSQHPEENYRELNFELILRLFETSPKKLSPLVDSMVALLIQGIGEASSKVKCAALQAATDIYARYDELKRADECLKFQPCLTQVLQAAAAAVSNGDDEVALKGLEFVQACCASAMELIDPHLQQLFPFLIFVMQSKVDIGTKQSAGQCLVECFANVKRAKRMGKDNLNLLINSASELVKLFTSETRTSSHFLKTISHTNDDEAEDDDYDESDDMDKVIFDILMTMAEAVPSKYISQALLPLYENCMSTAGFQKAGCLLFAASIEGCHAQIMSKLSAYMEPLVPSMASPNANVREVAFFAFYQLLEHCQPDIYTLYEHYLPHFVTNLPIKNEYIQICICDSIESLGTADMNLSGEIKPYVDGLLAGLSSIICGDSSNDTIVSAIDALGAIATILAEEFSPLTDSVFQILAPLISDRNPERREVCAHALQTFGLIGMSVGKDVFRPYFQPSLSAAVDLLSAKDEMIEEFVYIFISNTAACMVDEFGPYLPQLVPHMLTVIAQEESTAAQSGANDHADEEEDEGDEGDFVSDDEGDEEDGVMEGFINTKTACLDALGDLAQHNKEAFSPFLQQALTLTLQENINSRVPAVKQMAIKVCSDFVSVLKYAFAVQEIDTTTMTSLPAEFNNVVNVLLTTFLGTCVSEHEPGLVLQALLGLNKIVEEVGLTALALSDESGLRVFDKIDALIVAFLQKQAQCQKSNDEEEEDEDADTCDPKPIDAIFDLIGNLAAAMQDSFLDHFDKYVPLILPYLSDSDSSNNRKLAIGCFSEVIDRAKSSNAYKYCAGLLPYIQQGLNDEARSVRHNAAFCVCALVDTCSQYLEANLYRQFIQWLLPVCARPSESRLSIRFDVDNSIAAIVRIINKSSGSVDFATVMPVILNALPIRSDPEEGEIIYITLFQLLQNKEPITNSLLSQVIYVFAQAIGPASQDKDSTKQIVISQLRALMEQDPARFASAAAQITDAESAAVLNQLFSS